MRVKPSARSAIAAIVGYMVVVFSVWSLTGLEYDCLLYTSTTAPVNESGGPAPCTHRVA